MGLNEPMAEQDWRVQSAMNTLKEADKIQQDAKLMKKVSILASQEAKSLQKLAKPKLSTPKQPKSTIPKLTVKNAKAGKKGK